VRDGVREMGTWADKREGWGEGDGVPGRISARDGGREMGFVDASQRTKRKPHRCRSHSRVAWRRGAQRVRWDDDWCDRDGEH
jgi:hypothetical protein